MAPEALQSKQVLILPTLIFGTTEVRRLARELESYGEAIRQAELSKQESTARMSRLLQALADENRLDFGRAEDRQTMHAFLKTILTSAPVVHISFATDPSSAVMAKLVGWFRANVDPRVLVQVGLQPNIAAGCVVRTTNKVFDLSLRGHFADNRQLLIDTIGGTQSER